MSDVINYPLSAAIKLCEQLDNDQTNYYLKMLEYKRERDEAREERDKMQTELEMWRDGNIMHQIHRDELEKKERERDEAREALMKIEDLFIDGTDIYADRENMGIIARNALEETK